MKSCTINFQSRFPQSPCLKLRMAWWRRRCKSFISILQIEKLKLEERIILFFPSGLGHLALIILPLTQIVWDDVSFGVSTSVQKGYKFYLKAYGTSLEKLWPQESYVGKVPPFLIFPLHIKEYIAIKKYCKNIRLGHTGYFGRSQVITVGKNMIVCTVWYQLTHSHALGALAVT